MAFHLMDMGCGICTLILMVMDTCADPTDYGMQPSFRRTSAHRTMSQTGHAEGLTFEGKRHTRTPAKAGAHGSECTEVIEMWIPAFAGMRVVDSVMPAQGRHPGAAGS